MVEETNLKLPEPQIKVLMARKSLVLVMAGQRGGKTYGIGYRTGLLVKHFPKVPGMIAANTYLQLTQSTMLEVRKVWQKEYGFTEYDRRSNPKGVFVINKQPPPNFIIHFPFDNYHGIVSFKNGAVIFTASLDNYLVHEGKTLGWCELDETKDTKEQAIKQVILARLSFKGLYYNESGDLIYSEKPEVNLPSYNPCIINTSPAEGVVEWLLNMFNLKQHEEYIEQHIMESDKYIYFEDTKKAVCLYSTHWNAHNLTEGYIENRLDQLTDIEVKKFIYGYPFAATSDLYFPYFDYSKHVQKDVVKVKGLPDHLAYDFNLIPYMPLVCSQIVETETEIQIRVFKQYCFRPPHNTTEEVTEAYRSEHGDRFGDVFYYGDAMGNRGVEGFGDKVTRFDDVRKILNMYLSNVSDRTTTYNQGVLRRRSLLNKIFAGKAYMNGKKITILVDSECEDVIRDFRFLKLGIGGKLKELVKDKVTGRTHQKLGHTSDALEYFISYVFQELL